MDPLSITCAIITIIGAGNGVTKTIRKLALLKGAPASLLQLNNELADLSLAVRAIEEIQKSGEHSPPPETAHVYFTTALEEAREAVLDLEILIEQKLVNLSTKKLDRLSWMRAEPTIVKMKERVRSAKVNLVAATNVLTWTTTNSLDFRVQQLESTMTAFLSKVAIMNDSTTHLSQIESLNMEEQYAESIGPSASASQMWNPIGSISERSSIVGYGNRPLALGQDQDVTEVLVSPQNRCPPACSCVCHRKFKWSTKTPQLLDRALGSLFVGYQASPQCSVPCDSKSCIKQSKRNSTFSVTYIFPNWWMRRWAISFTAAPEYQLRVLRIRSRTDPVFKALSALNLPAVRKMLQDGRASVLDVNEDGQSLLTWSIFCHGQSPQSTAIVKMLIDAGSDIRQEDQCMMTPYTYVWTGFLRHGDHQMFTKELLDMFGSSADLESLGLTNLHAAILGIGNETIADSLLATTRTSVDTQDLIGMTALAWATTRGDISTMRQLLRKGADPNLADKQGRITLHHWVKGGDHDCLKLLLKAGAEPDRPDKFGETPFLRAMYFFKNVQVRSLDLLIAHGANAQRQSLEGWTGIHLTIRWNWNDTARLDCLLRHGLDINKMDEDHMTPLMIALVHNIPKAVDDLLARGASHLGRMKGGREFLHIIAAFADIPTMQVLARHQSIIDSLDIDALDDAGQTPLEIAKTRVAQRSSGRNDPEKHDEELADWYESFSSLIDNNSSEIFYDTIC
ncbi:ankyrin repeat-containing domain protein [Nemania abortiva]|nr:ankyrin repeat-containing domain protein [Nemania abortiva]